MVERRKLIVADLDQQGKSLIVKSNRLIEASYRLTTQEQRLILMMSSMIKPEDKDFHTYQIAIKDFNRIVGLKTKDSYDKTKEVTKKLLTRVLNIKSEKSILQISWLSSAEYFEGKGYVELSFDPKLKPYLLQLKKFFTQYQLKDVVRLRRANSVRVYELLKQYQKVGKRSFDLIELRQILGIKPHEYKLYGHFKSRVLLPAQKELAQKTDIQFDFKEKKTGRKVTGLIFVIYSNRKIKDEELYDIDKEVFGESATINKELRNKLIKYFCLSSSQARDILKTYDEDRIKENLKYVKDKYNQGLINDIGAYTIKAIKEDYRSQKSFFDLEKEEKQRQQEKEDALKRLSERLEDEYRTLKVAEAEKAKNKLSDDEIEEIESIIDSRLKKKGQDGIGKKIFFRLEMENYLAQKAGLEPFEEWRKKRMKELQK